MIIHKILMLSLILSRNTCHVLLKDSLIQCDFPQGRRIRLRVRFRRFDSGVIASFHRAIKHS